MCGTAVLRSVEMRCTEKRVEASDDDAAVIEKVGIDSDRREWNWNRMSLAAEAC
jgi:hypothetical protein